MTNSHHPDTWDLQRKDVRAAGLGSWSQSSILLLNYTSITYYLWP